jgi:zinc protease
MIQRLIIVLALVLAAVPVRHAQTLAHEKYQLDNGLTVILHEDHSLPTVSINLWYRVGARNEPPGRSGFAHLFEHLMFMGTKRAPGNTFDVLMETGGGANNATTSLDRTNYFSWGPSELLPTLLWLDADRLEDMAVTMTQEKLDKQKAVVRNERRQTMENAPYGKAADAVYQLVYRPEHPYHNAVIGTHEDLENATVQDVMDFFGTFYAPENCSLVVAGDFKSAEIKPLVAQYFGSLQRGNSPPVAPAPPSALDRVIRTTSYDKVQLPKVAFSYHSPPQYREGDAECDLLASILGSGQSSRLYQRLVLRDQTAVAVNAYQNSGMLGSLFQIEVIAKRDADLGALERAVDEELATIFDIGPSEDEVRRFATQIEVGKISGLQAVQSRADRLNEYEFFFGNPDSLERDLARYRSATGASVRRVAQHVLTRDARLIQRVLPQEPQRAAGPRDNTPSLAGAAGAFEPAAPEVFKLSNGIQVQLWSRPAVKGGLPLAAASIVFLPGGELEPAARAGATSLACEMLSEGTGDMDGSAFAAAMESLGATFGAGAGTESISVSVSGLSRTFDRAVELWARAIGAPRMDASDFDRVKSLQLQNLAQSDEEPNVVAQRATAAMLLGTKNPYGRPLSGTPASIGTLSLDQIRSAHAELLRPEFATLLIAGDLTKDQALELLERTIGAWRADATTRPRARTTPDYSIPGVSGLRIGIVDRPGAVQTVVTFAAPGLTSGDAKRVPFELINTILGGSFTSRLNQNLREDKGYTYGARSAFSFHSNLGWFTARASVRADVTGASIQEFLKEMDRLRAGDITADEATKAFKTLKQDLVRSLGTLRGVLGAASELVVNGQTWATLSADVSAAERLRPTDLNPMAVSALPKDMILVLVGDKQTIVPQLEKIGIAGGIVELDTYGNPLISGR